MRIEEDIAILGRVAFNFRKLSSKLFKIYNEQNEVERQKSTFHLGLIARAFKGVNHSRYDYLILQCIISDLSENNFKGTISAQGSIKVDGTKYEGNDLIKTWALLSNFGHCKNTIGDEKALLLRAIDRKTFKTFLINGIKDEQLKTWAAETIDNFDYVNFHHILSIRRLYKCLRRKIKEQDEFIKVYKLLLLSSELITFKVDLFKVEQLKSIHKNIRNLAIISLDSRNSSLPINIDILSTVLSFDFFESRFHQTKINDLLEPLLSTLYDHLYLHPNSQAHQRSYEIEALNNGSFDEVQIQKALNNGLADPEQCNISHFLRIPIDLTEDLNINDFSRSVQLVKRGVPHIESSIDINPLSKTIVIDFYFHKEHFSYDLLPRFLFNIVSIIENQINKTFGKLVESNGPILSKITESLLTKGLNKKELEEVYLPIKDFFKDETKKLIRERNIPSFKGILWTIIKAHFKDQYSFDIDYHLSDDYEYFGVKLSDKLDYLTPELNKAITTTSDPDRIHELKQLQKATQRNFEGYKIACLARITIYDYSQPPSNTLVTDIDSVLLRFNKEELILEFFEGKNTRRSVNDAKKDLKKKFVRVLNSNAKYRIKEVANFGAKIVITHKMK